MRALITACYSIGVYCARLALAIGAGRFEWVAATHNEVGLSGWVIAPAMNALQLNPRGVDVKKCVFIAVRKINGNGLQ